MQGNRDKFLHPPLIETSARFCFGDWQPHKGVSEGTCYDDTGNREIWRWQIRGWVEGAWLVADRWLVFQTMRGFDATVGVWDMTQKRTVTLPGQAWIQRIDEAASTVTTLNPEGQSHSFSFTNLEPLPASQLVVDVLRDPPPQPRAPLPPTDKTPAPLWSEDSRTVAAVRGARLEVHQLPASGSFVRVLDLPSEQESLGFSPTGRYFLVQGRTALTAYDLLHGRAVLSIPMVRRPRDSWGPKSMAFCFSEQKALLALAESELQIRIWDLAKGEELLRLSPQKPVRRLWFFENGGSLIAVTNDSVERYLWQAEDLLQAAEKRLAPDRVRKQVQLKP